MKSKILNKFSDKSFKDLFKSSSIVMIAKVFGVILGFITNIIIARNYGADTVGMVALVNSFITIVSLFVLFGTNTSILKLIPQYQVKYSISSSYYLFKKSLILVFGLGVLISILLWFTSPIIAENIFKNSDLVPYFMAASLFIFFISAKEFNLSALRGLHDIKIFSILNLLPSVLTLVAISITTFYFYDKSTPIYIYILVPASMFFVTLYFVSKKFKEKLPLIKEENINKIKFNEILLISSPMFLISGMHLVMSQTDIIMIGMYMSEKDVGLYAIAMKLALLTSFVLNAVNSVVSPKFSQYYHANDMETLKKTAKDSSKLIFYTTFPILIFLIIFGKYILGIFGEEFEKAYLVLVILIIGQMVNSFSGSVGYFLNMTGNQAIYQKVILVGLFINIILNVLLIPLYGLIGAAIATSISLALWNLLALLSMKQKFNFTTVSFGK
jgi:O-antigen/teichoic acid export membrane protein